MKYIFRSRESYCFLLFALLSCLIPVNAQDIQWEKSYGGKHADYLFDAQPTADYGFILAGSSLSRKTGKKTQDNSGNLDYWLWKMDEHGEEVWQKNIGGEGMDLLQAIRLTNDGGFILAGNSDSQKGIQKKDSCRGQADYWVIKLDANGGEQWQKTLGGSGQEMLQSVCLTSDGGFVLGGSSSSPISAKIAKGDTDINGKSENGFGNMDYWIVKLDSKGTVQWQRTIGGEYADLLRSVELTKDGGFILGGYSTSPDSGNKTVQNYGVGDYYIVKLDKNGSTEWEKTLGGDKDDQMQVIHQTADGNYVAAGYSNSGASGTKTKSNQNGSDFWLVKFDEKGEILWQQTYNNGKIDILTSLVENADHTLLIGGHSQSETMGTKKKDKEGINDFVAIKLKENGEEIWTQTVGSSGEDVLKKAIETRDGGYLLAGTSEGKVSKDKNSTIGRNDFWVVKLKDKDKPKEKKQAIEAIPNPARDFTNIIIGYDFISGTCTVVDMAGHVLQQFAVTKRTVPVDLSRYPQGIYVVNIKTNVQSDGVKVMKAGN